MQVYDWFLTPSQRGNASTSLDRRHHDGSSWTAGNDVEALIHGATYFPELLRCVRAMRAGDLLLFTDWRGDPDQLLDGPGTEVSRMLCEAAARGVVVKGLIWRSHLDRFAFSEQENRHLGEDIEAAGGECLRDMRVRPGGSHHQKFVVLRHPGRPELDVAFVGGIDLCHGRLDGPEHGGDPQRQPMAQVYGPRPPWHDIQLAVRGPAVADVETVFRERWDDPAPLTRNPFDRLGDLLRREDRPRRRPAAAVARPAAARDEAGAAAADLPQASARVPVRPGRRAQRRPRLRQGDRPRAQPDLPRGPVFLGQRRGALFRRRAAGRPLVAPDRRHPAPPRSGRTDRPTAEPGRAAAGAG